jgi:predicted  nucleic acid-binding Zn-ribbon protein
LIRHFGGANFLRLPFFGDKKKQDEELLQQKIARAQEESLKELIETKQRKIEELEAIIREQQKRSTEQQTTNESLKTQVKELEGSLTQLREQLSKDLTKPGQFQSKLTNFQKTILCYLFNGVERVDYLAQKLRVTVDNLDEYLKPLEHLELIKIQDENDLYLTDNGYETALETPQDIKDAVKRVLETETQSEKQGAISSELQTLRTELKKKEETIAHLEDRIERLKDRTNVPATQWQQPTQMQQPPSIRVEQKQTSGWAVCGIVCLIIFIIFVIAIAFSPELLKWLFDPSRWFGGH